MGAVHPFPGKIVIRELIPFIIRPENLLCYQVFYTAAPENLGKGGSISERIRQPQHLAVHTQHFLIIAFSMNQLAYKRFTAGHVGIRFHPHGSVGNPLAAPDGFPDPFKKLRIIGSAHFIRSGLALDKFIFRIFLQQTKLCGKGSFCFAVCFCHRPQPGQIQMCVAHYSLHGRTQSFPGGTVAGNPFFLILFKIHDEGEFLQRLCDLCGSQGSVIQSFQQLIQGIYVHIQLIGILIPDSIGTAAQSPSGAFRQGIRKGTRKNRTGSAASVRTFGIIMSGIGFHQDFIAASGFPFPCQHIILHIMMRFADPVCPESSESLSVYEEGGLAAGFQIHDNPFPFRFRGQFNMASEPAILIGIAPCKSGLDRSESHSCSFLRTKMLHGSACFPPEFSQRFIKIVFQRTDPVLNPPAPF